LSFKINDVYEQSLTNPRPRAIGSCMRILSFSCLVFSLGFVQSSEAEIPLNRSPSIAVKTAFWAAPLSPITVGTAALVLKGGVLWPVGSFAVAIPVYALSAFATGILLRPFLMTLPRGKRHAERLAFFIGIIPTIQTCSIMLYSLSH